MRRLQGVPGLVVGLVVLLFAIGIGVWLTSSGGGGNVNTPTELEQQEEQPDVGWTGPSGHVSRELLEELLAADRRHWSYFVCGPPGMTDTAEAALRELGIPRGSIRVGASRLPDRYAPPGATSPDS